MAELSHKFSPKQELAKYISKNITATKNVYRMGGMMIPYIEFMANLRNTFKIHVPNLKWFPIFYSTCLMFITHKVARHGQWLMVIAQVAT